MLRIRQPGGVFPAPNTPQPTERTTQGWLETRITAVRLGLPRRPLRHPGTKSRRTLPQSGQNADFRHSLPIHTPHVVTSPSRSRAPDFSRIRRPAVFPRTLPGTPVPGPSIKKRRSPPHSDLVGLPLRVQIFGPLPPAPGGGQLYHTLRKFPKNWAVRCRFRESLGKFRKVG